jgi:hypothetical protein
MGSNMKKTKLVRARKAKPNKKNIKTNMKRLQDNHAALKGLAEKEED